VIDDDEISRYLLTELLADTRYRVIEAADGEEGLKRAREEKPKYIILDLNMPDISGFEVLDLLKSDPATRNIPVIINTAQVLTESERERISAKAVAILSKDMASREAAITRIRQA